MEASVARVWKAVGGPGAFRARIAPQRPQPPTLSPERVASEAGAVYARFRKAGEVDAVPGLTPAEARRAVGASVAWRLAKARVPGYVPPASGAPLRPAVGSAADLDGRAALVARNKAVYGGRRDVGGRQHAVEKAAVAVARHLRASGRLDAMLGGRPRAGRAGAARPSAGPGRGAPSAQARGRAARPPGADSKSKTRRSAKAPAAGAPGRAAVVRRAGAAVGGGPAAGAGSNRASGAPAQGEPGLEAQARLGPLISGVPVSALKCRFGALRRRVPKFFFALETLAIGAVRGSPRSDRSTAPGFRAATFPLARRHRMGWPPITGPPAPVSRWSPGHTA